MYRPAHFAVDDPARLHAVINANPFATIACSSGDGVAFAYAPVVLDTSDEALGTLLFHLARANPVAGAPGRTFTFSFRGPDAYVSPDWYETEALVPTWNYVAVEATGIARRLADNDLQKLLVSLSDLNERKLAPKKPWTIDKISTERLSAMMRAIVGFSVRIETLKGKFKLSQDKSERDIEGVAAALEARGEAGSLAVARAMRARS